MTNVTIARDMQGLPRGFAHVEFSYEVEAQNALSLSGEQYLQSGSTRVLAISKCSFTNWMVGWFLFERE